MSDIGGAIETAVKYLREHPEEARYTDSAATATIEHGLRVKVEGPAGEIIVTDMARSVGGGDSAPSPGWLFRAALAACDATLIAMRAAQEGVTLTGLEVSVDSESDDRGVLGVDPEVPPGPYGMRVRVRAGAQGVDGARLREIVEWGLEHCPVCDAVKRSVEITTEVRVED